MNNQTENNNFSKNQTSQNNLDSLTQERATESNAIQIPEISLPKGGGALKGIDEKFEVNAANGTASFSIPLPITPGRNGFAPSLSLSYNSGGGNSPFGLGWSVGIPSIQRKTDRRLPRYFEDTEDTFMFSGAEDLVPFLKKNGTEWETIEKNVAGYKIKRYRPRIEGGFARIEKIKHEGYGIYWKVTTRDNITTFFGKSPTTRIANPENPSQIFQWLPEFSYDDKGNWLLYEYKEENLDLVSNVLHEKNRINGLAAFTNQYLKRVKYGNRRPWFANPLTPYDYVIPSDAEYFFEVVMDYGEHDEMQPIPSETASKKWDYRPDAFSSYRSGFEIRTNRLCKRVLMFHHFEEEEQLLGFEEDGTKIVTLFGSNYLVRSLNFEYEPSSINESGQSEVTYLKSIIQVGYIRKPDNTYAQKILPPLEFTYQQLNWNKTIKTVNQESIFNAPVGLTNNYQWVDLYGVGISGILTEQGEGWYYKDNLGDTDEDGAVRFAPIQKVAPKPSFNGINAGVLSLQDLAANGQKQIVVNSVGVQGYFELTTDNDWNGFAAFEERVNIDLNDPNTRLLDLNGDGQADIVLSEDNVFTWYAAKGKQGYDSAEVAPKPFDEEKGPAIVFADSEQTIFLGDCTGDGSTDIIRIRNGEICYWANKGYGKFSAKVTMSNAPLFDLPELFNPKYLHLADISGTGTTDILYLGESKFKAYINLSGNAWSNVHEIDPFFPVDANSRISAIDFLGTGTTCIVWSSDLEVHQEAPMRYIDLMDSKKPHVLIQHKNNLGKETTIEYKSSTHFYLKDKLEGKPWITKLPFPVQVISKLVIEEKITDVRFSTEYRYHHGYYDHPEREFRGFTFVEQLDTEFYNEWKENNTGNQLEKSEALYQAPVLTKTWFHTGAYLDRERVLTQFKEEYWIPTFNQQFPDTPISITEPELKDAIIESSVDLIGDEYREVFRACKGMMLRQEVFALDAKNEEAPTYQRQFKPYTVATHNCQIQLLQPRTTNEFAVFIVTEGEAITHQYERNELDPRIAHTLNIKIDELGNILESASVVYPRQEKDTSLPQVTQDVQNKTLIIYTQNSFTNDVITDSHYRLRLPAEAKIFEITQLEKSGSELLYEITDFTEVLTTESTEIDYHFEPSETDTQRRLIEHIRTIYAKDNLEGALALGQLEAKGFPYENYQLAYTNNDHLSPQKGLFDSIFEDKIAFTDELMEEGRFVHSEGDNNWWIRSGLINFMADGESVEDAANRFYIPLSYTDPFGAATKVSYYKDYFLFVEGTEDVLENKTKIEQFNFRQLGPQITRDINDNLSGVLVDELGLVKAVALLGKDLNGTGIHPNTEQVDNFNGLTEITAQELTNIQDFFASEDSNELNSIGQTLIKNASGRFLYDFEIYQNTNRPTVTASINRETHTSQLATGQQSKLQFAFEYSEGLGNVVMAKVQAEPGIAKKVTIEADNQYSIQDVNTINTIDSEKTTLRWVGNGRTILNNKGNPVKQYEPYFSVTPFYEDNKELVEDGVSPILYYDAASRLICTELPNETFSKVEFTPWQQISYDPNDTAGESLWYQKRINNEIDEELLAEGKDPSKEKLAAQKTAHHHNTPTIIHLDTLGRPILSIAHNRVKSGEVWQDEFYPTIIHLDIEGNATSVVDARDNVVMSWKYDLLGHRVFQKSMDAGKRWMLNNVMGNPIKRWDERNHTFSFSYDVLQRPLKNRVIGGDGEQILDNIYERITYGENSLNDKLRNRRGQVYQHFDTAGRVTFDKFDLKGNLLQNTRTFAKEYKETVNWSGTISSLDDLLESDSYSNGIRYDALNRVIWSKTSDESIQMPSYNEANFLETVEIVQNGGTPKLFVKNIDYNAKGQREKITYGNNITTKYTYEQATFRLLHLETKKQSEELLQDLYYNYDPVGNIAEIEDKCQPEIFFAGEKTTHRNQYLYDPLYRLIEASGREHIAQANFSPKDNWNDLPFLKKYSPNDPMAWRTYTQKYDYDGVGNILQMRHQATGGSWTRGYNYETENNRLYSTIVGDNTFTYKHHVQHGFIQELAHLEIMEWNFRDELQAVAKQKVIEGTPETTYYVYDASGQRVRKITENQAIGTNTPTKKEERLYLGGIEIYQKNSGSNSGLERTTLHITDDTQRIAMIDSRNGVNDGTDIKTTRYQFSNHLGTTTLETDEVAAIISYEEYHPYGTTSYQAVNINIKTVGKRFRYTGKERDDESGLYYHGARYYLCWLGKWCKPDPGGLIDGLNLFQYVLSNPVKLKDKNGENSGEGNDDKIIAALKEKYGSDYPFTEIKSSERKGNYMVFQMNFGSQFHLHIDKYNEVLGIEDVETENTKTEIDRTEVYLEEPKIDTNIEQNPEPSETTEDIGKASHVVKTVIKSVVKPTATKGRTVAQKTASLVQAKKIYPIVKEIEGVSKLKAAQISITEAIKNTKIDKVGQVKQPKGHNVLYRELQQAVKKVQKAKGVSKIVQKSAVTAKNLKNISKIAVRSTKGIVKSSSRFIPGVNIAIAATDIAIAVNRWQDPDATRAEKALGGIRAVTSSVAALSIPGISQGASSISFGIDLLEMATDWW